MGTTDPVSARLRTVAEQLGALTEIITEPTPGTIPAPEDSSRANHALATFVAANKLTVYGHSYTPVPGHYVTPNTGEWSSKLAAKLGIERLSHGISGACMMDMAKLAIGGTLPNVPGNRIYTPGQPGAVAIQCVMNDALYGPTSPEARNGFRNALRSLMATVMAGQRIESSTATETGTWGTFNSAQMSGGSCRYTSAAGATMTFNNVTAPSGLVHILTIANGPSNSVAPFTVAVDGVDQGITYNGKGQMVGFTGVKGNLHTEGPAVVAVPVPPTGTHSVKITRVGTTGTIYVDGLLVPAAVPPPVLVLKDPPVGHLTTQARQDAWAANSPALHQIIDEVAAEFPTATVVDLGPGWDAEIMAARDDNALFHPNEDGMQHIADRVAPVLVEALVRRLALKMWA